jgi:hypothetical protein
MDRTQGRGRVVSSFLPSATKLIQDIPRRIVDLPSELNRLRDQRAQCSHSRCLCRAPRCLGSTRIQFVLHRCVSSNHHPTLYSQHHQAPTCLQCCVTLLQLSLLGRPVCNARLGTQRVLLQHSSPQSPELLAGGGCACPATSNSQSP